MPHQTLFPEHSQPHRASFQSPYTALGLAFFLMFPYPTGRAATAPLHTPALNLIVVDNEADGPTHRAGYNGIASLQHTDASSNVFVPFYAGLNLEHIFSGDQTSYAWNIFEPRRAPMNLQTASDAVILSQTETEHWPLKSQIRFTSHGEAIDMTYTAVPTSDAWSKHGYIGVFFASYIHQPEELGIHFIGRSRPGQGNPTPRWIYHLPPEHGTEANHRPAGSTWDPPIDPGMKISLASGFSSYEYLYPFYYGRIGTQAFIMMFRRPDPEAAEIRLAQSPSGGGPGNPAWDFIFYQRRYTIGQAFTFQTRMILKTFVSEDDIIRLYEQWSGEKVHRPSANLDKINP